MSVNILKVFNDHLLEFVEDIENVFPEEVDIKTAKNLFITIKKTNPRLIPKAWFKYVAEPYREQVERGDYDFFINKDYSTDLSRHSHGDKIVEAIDRLRAPIKNMNAEDQAKTMEYVQNLSRLCYDYNDQLIKNN